MKLSAPIILITSLKDENSLSLEPVQKPCLQYFQSISFLIGGKAPPFQQLIWEGESCAILIDGIHDVTHVVIAHLAGELICKRLFRKILIEYVLTRKHVQILPVTSIGSSVDGQIHSRLPRVRKGHKQSTNEA